MIFERKTKWEILITYNNGGKDYIIFCRKGKRTGMLFFKVKSPTPFLASYNFSTSLFNIKEQFEKILSL